ncbi:MAG: MFS transporter [Myxococcota bacterium]|nr:MFS transporter [Myxococcota bacterium]
MIPLLRNHLGGLPSIYWYVWGGTLINRLGGFVVPFLALYLTDQVGLPISTAGKIAALYGLGSLMAGLVGGTVSDRFGRKPTLVLGLGIGSVAMLGLGLSTQLTWIGLCTFGVGFFSDLSRPAVSAIISDVVPPADRARAYGLLHWAVNIGFSVAPLIAGYLATRNYLALFVADALTTFAYACFVLFKVPETRPMSLHVRPPLFKNLAAPLGDRNFLAFGLLGFLLALVFFQFEAALPIDMRVHGVQPDQYGALIAINGILIAVLQPFSSGWVARFRRSRVLAASAVLFGVGFGLPALMPTVTIFALGIVIWTLGEILNSPISQAIVADLAPEQSRGSYQGALQVVWGAAFFLAPALGTWVLEWHGGRTLWIGCLLLGLAVAGAHLVIAGPRRRRVAQLRLQTPGQVSVADD